MAKLSELSVFFPAYNEEANIAKTVKEAAKILPQVASKYEIIIIDDGSRDKTGEIADQLAKGNEFIRVIHHHPNQGYGASLKSGFYNSRYLWIACTDSDGQFDFSEITNFLKMSGEVDLVVGFRLNRQDPFPRKLFGWGWTKLANILLGISVKDVDCGFKLVKKKVIEQIPKLESSRGGMISPELLAKAKKEGFKIAEVGVHHYPRKIGQQSGADLKVIINSFADLIKLWWKIR